MQVQRAALQQSALHRENVSSFQPTVSHDHSGHLHQLVTTVEPVMLSNPEKAAQSVQEMPYTGAKTIPFDWQAEQARARARYTSNTSNITSAQGPTIMCRNHSTEPANPVLDWEASWKQMDADQARRSALLDRALGEKVLASRATPRATMLVDVNGDGRADYVVSSEDLDRDGIPDILQVLYELYPNSAPQHTLRQFCDCCVQCADQQRSSTGQTRARSPDKGTLAIEVSIDGFNLLTMFSEVEHLGSI